MMIRQQRFGRQSLKDIGVIQLAIKAPMLIALGCVAVIATPALAQFQLDIVGDADAVFPKEVYVEVTARNQVAARNLALQQRGMNFNINQNINSWVFSTHRTVSKAEKHLNTQLILAIDSLDRSCQFSDAQKEKLHLAGQGDITLFFAQVAQIKAEFAGQQNQNMINEVYQRVRPLQSKMQNEFFGVDSIMSRVSLQTLNEEQRIRYRKAETERRQFAYRAAIKMAVANIEKTSPLRATQRTKLIELLIESDPPLVLGKYVNYYVIYQLSQLSEQLEGFLDEGQMRAMSAIMNQGRSMEPTLKQQGYIK